MKKYLLTLVVAVLAIPMSLKAQTVVLSESFEQGIPSTWVQENVAGNQAWIVETVDNNIDYPNSVYDGKARVAIRNTSGHSLGYKTRLVLPEVDLSNVFQPVLQFAYANMKWSGDCDTLRIFYRTGAKESWSLLKEYANAQQTWKKEVIELPHYGKTYQVCFEATDGLGHGLVLDSVMLRSMPECTVPYDLSTSGMGNGKVTINWLASFDAYEFNFVIAKESIDPNNLHLIDPEVLVYNDNVPGLVTHREVELEMGLHYYVYIRSVCDGEVSNWSEELAFRMKQAYQIPYFENFNMDYTGNIGRNNEWSYGNNMQNENPFISSNVAAADLKKYSVDATTCLVFSGANNATTAIPAKYYAYAATPELEGAALKDCQVRFSASVYQATGRQYAHSLQVGVMTDPEDVTTFTKLATVSVWGSQSFEEKVVSLAEYTGEGKYVGFLSEADEANLFFLDNLTVEKRTAENSVSNVVVNPRATSATITWNGTASEYEVIVATAKTLDVNNLATTDIVKKATVSAASYLCEGLESFRNWNAPYYVYVRAKNGTWSMAVPFVTLAKLELPFTFEMEEAASYYMGNIAAIRYPNNLAVFSNDNNYTYLSTDVRRSGASSLYLSKTFGTDAYVVLPVVDDLKAVELSFYITANYQYEQCFVKVGVMTNPMDPTTFNEVASFRPSDASMTRCYANFVDYDGPQGVIAIIWADLDKVANTICYLDDIDVRGVSSCRPVSGLEVVNTDYSATFSWNRGGAEKWELVLATSVVSEAILNGTASSSSAVVLDTVISRESNEECKFTLDNLNFSQQYYFYMRTLCGTETTMWATGLFHTDCANLIRIPYTENFDHYYSDGYKQIPCWNGDYSFSFAPSAPTTKYPYLYTTTLHSGSHSLYLYGGPATSNPQYGSLVALPEFNQPLQDLVVEGWIYGALGQELEVGVMTDVNDPATFELVGKLAVFDGNTWELHGIDLGNYKGQGKHLAFRKFQSGSICLDDLSVHVAKGAAPVNVEGQALSATAGKITWGGQTDAKWRLLVLNTNVNVKDYTIGTFTDDNVVVDTLVNDKECVITGLNANTQYFVYVTPDGDEKWAKGYLQTECAKISAAAGFLENFESYTGVTSAASGKQPNCWTYGNLKSTSATYLPYIYKSATYATSGNNTFRIYSSATYAPAWVATPEIDTEDMTNLILNFGYSLSTSYYLIVGVMSDPTDLSTFTVLDSIKGQGNKKTYRIVMSNYADILANAKDAKYIGFRTGYAKAATIYLDDVQITEAACPVPNVTVANITPSSARVLSGLRQENDWRLVVTDKQLTGDNLLNKTYTFPTGVNVIFDDTITTIDRSLTINGLEGNTTYYVTCCAYCGETPADYVSSLVSQTSFTTLCTYEPNDPTNTISFEQAEGFTTYGSGKAVGCWIVGNLSDGATTTYIPYINNGTSYAHTGTRALYINTTATYNGAYAIMPGLDVKSVNDLQIDFYGKTTSTAITYEQKLLVGIVTDPGDMATFVPIDTIYGVGTTQYSHYTVSFENYEGDMNGQKGKHIAFVSNFPLSNTWYIDDIVIGPKSTGCDKPRQLTRDAATDTEASLHWRGNSAKYRVVVSKVALPDSVKDTYDAYLWDQEVKEPRVVVKGLQAATRYYMYVKSICSATESSDWSDVNFSFLTECADQFELPYSCDFNSNSYTAADAYSKPDCWTTSYTQKGVTVSAQTYPQTVANIGYDGTPGLRLYANKNSTSTNDYATYAILPPVNGKLAECMLSFDAHSYYNGTSYHKQLIVGVLNSQNYNYDTISAYFVPLDTLDIPYNTVFDSYRVVLDKYADKIGNADQIGFCATMPSNAPTSLTSLTIDVDNVVLQKMPTCFEPTISVSEITETSAWVDIVPYAEGQEHFELALLTKQESQGLLEVADIEKKFTVIAVDTFGYRLNNLKESSQYVLYARTLCSADDKSEWSRGVEFITPFHFENGYNFTFEKTQPWQRIKDATSNAYYLHPAIVTGFDETSGTGKFTSYPHVYVTDNFKYAYEDEGALLFYNAGSSSTITGQFAILPKLDAPKGNHQLKFKLRIGYEYDGKLTGDAPLKFAIGTVDNGKGMETYEQLVPINPAHNAGAVPSVDNDFLFETYVLELSEELLAKKQLVLYNASSNSTSAYLCVDNVELAVGEGWSSPYILAAVGQDTTATMSWYNTGGKWNVYVLTGSDAKLGTGTVIKTYKDITDTNITIGGLQTGSDYTLALEETRTSADPLVTNLVYTNIKTSCLSPDMSNPLFKFTFDDGNIVSISPTDYMASYGLMPECWTIRHSADGGYDPGIMYGWFLGRYGYDPMGGYEMRGDYVAMGRNNSNAMVGPASNTKSTMSLPYLRCDLDTMQIEFWGRNFSHYTSGYNMNHPYPDGRQLEYTRQVVIGGMDDPLDLNTFHPLDTVTYSYLQGAYDCDVTTDPNGNEYWERFLVPLKGIQGQFVTFYMPCTDGGYFFIDDVAFGKMLHLAAPKNLDSDNLTSSSAHLTWYDRHPEAARIVVVSSMDGTELLRDTLATGNEFTAQGLKPDTQYQWYVYLHGTIDSEPSKTATFYTDCVVLTPAYTTGFEETEGTRVFPGQTNETYKITSCWTYGAISNYAFSSSWPYNHKSTTTSSYAHSGAYGVNLIANSSTQPYIVLPAIPQEAMDTLQVNFYARPALHNPTTGKISAQYTTGTGTTAATQYAKTVVVGTCTDPSDVSTFVPLDTVTYEATLTTQDEVNEDNDYKFQRFSVGLTKAVGPYVYIMACRYQKGNATAFTQSQMMIDDVSFSRNNDCTAPYGLVVDNIMDVTANLAWKGNANAQRYVVQVSEDQTFAIAPVVDDTVTATAVALSGLQKNVIYYARVRALCCDNDDECASDWSGVTNFKTYRTPFYLEDFHSENLDAEWIFDTIAINYIQKQKYAYVPFYNYARKEGYAWQRTEENLGIEGPHFVATFYGPTSGNVAIGNCSKKHWMISPVVLVPEDGLAHMTVDLALTAASGNDLLDEPATNLYSGYTFTIAISEDEGETWKEADMKTWTGSQLQELTSLTNYEVDLKPYAGKKICVGFYRSYSRVFAGNIAIHVGNLRFNRYIVENETAVLCQYEDLDYNGFFIDGTNSEAGEFTFTRKYFPTEIEGNRGVADTVVNLTVTYLESPRTVVSETICAGETSAYAEFGSPTEAGVYRYKTLTNDTHCDSIVTLTLNVLPRLTSTEDAFLCPGETYEWNGKTYNHQGVYVDTLKASTGCDSIAVLNLNYLTGDTIYIAETINENDLPYTYATVTYAPGQATITYPVGTKPGTYTATVNIVKDGAECYSTLVHTLTIVPAAGIDIIYNEDGSVRCGKFLIDGTMYLVHESIWYDATGRKVGKQF